MTQESERIDRIEAALDRQVAVNAELRTSVETLRTSVTELRATTEALLGIAQIHQQNFEVLAASEQRREARFEEFQRTTAASEQEREARFEEFQRTTNAAIERIGAILDYLVRQQGNGSTEGM